jgi:hypothetical protein
MPRRDKNEWVLGTVRVIRVFHLPREIRVFVRLVLRARVEQPPRVILKMGIFDVDCLRRMTLKMKVYFLGVIINYFSSSVRDKECKFVNIFTAVVLWSLWKTRNNLCFQVSQWFMCTGSLRSWSMLISDPGVMERWVTELEARSVRLMRITWEQRDPVQNRPR